VTVGETPSVSRPPPHSGHRSPGPAKVVAEDAAPALLRPQNMKPSAKIAYSGTSYPQTRWLPYPGNVSPPNSVGLAGSKS
jgi:hypothetical protein